MDSRPRSIWYSGRNTGMEDQINPPVQRQALHLHTCLPPVSLGQRHHAFSCRWNVLKHGLEAFAVMETANPHRPQANCSSSLYLEARINLVRIPFYMFSEARNLQGFKLQPLTRSAVVLNALPAASVGKRVSPAAGARSNLGHQRLKSTPVAGKGKAKQHQRALSVLKRSKRRLLERVGW